MNLFIDTHLNDIIIILENNNEIIRKRIINEKKQSSTIIISTIEEILKDVKPDSIIVVNGPGSFTGVRLGVTIAKTLAYTLDVPIRTITSLECIAICVKDEERIVGFNANNGYFIGIFDDEMNLIGNYEYLTSNQFDNFEHKHKVIQDVELDYNEIISYALTKKVENPHKVNPIYIKKIDVEK